MIRRSCYLLAAVACLATAPATAQQPAAQTRAEFTPPTQAGPRLDPGFKRYQPKLTEQQHAVTTAAAADRTVITISTLGLVLLAILLIVLLA